MIENPAINFLKRLFYDDIISYGSIVKAQADDDYDRIIFIMEEIGKLLVKHINELKAEKEQKKNDDSTRID